MSPGDPRHGTHAGYVQGCRCDPCRLGRYRHEKAAGLRRLTGPLVVPSDRAQAHLERCLALGMPLAVFDRAGVRVNVLRPTIHATTERKILAVQPTPGTNWFPRHGAVRRLRALIALGHSQRMLADRLGIGHPHMSEIVTESRGFDIRPDLWRRIATLYDELSMQTGDSTRSRGRAAKNGWAPPLAWDDSAIDYPDGTPAGHRDRGRRKTDVDEAVVLRLLDGERLPCTNAERNEAMRRWKARGGSELSLCEMQGWKAARYGREDVA